MNNEPVAWMYYDAWNKLKLGKTMPPDPNWFPVYTHPAKCNKCNDTEWVCENHPDQEAHKCSHCEGAGKPCECTHPAKELHLSLQKSKETGELLAVTYTDDEHRIVEVLWQKPPAKTLTDDEIIKVNEDIGTCWDVPHRFAIQIARAILRKAQEK